jgi:hypothetical protein
MNINFKTAAPLIIGILSLIFASIILVVGNFLSDWPVAVIPIIMGAFFLALYSNNKRKALNK